MPTVNMHEAKSQLSALVEAANAGEEVIIARAGKPVARLVPFEPADQPRKPGGWDGRIWIADDFDRHCAELAAAGEQISDEEANSLIGEAATEARDLTREAGASARSVHDIGEPPAR